MNRFLTALLIGLLAPAGAAQTARDQALPGKRALVRPRRTQVTPARKAAARQTWLDHLAENWDGTGPGEIEAALAYHEFNMRRNGRVQGQSAAAALPGASFNAGQIAIIEDDPTVVSPVPFFDLEGRGLRFTPDGAGGYTTSVIALNFDANIGPNRGLTDDSFIQIPFILGFTFSFYGIPQSSVFVGSNGYLTFGEGDGNPFASDENFLSPLPRIAALFIDLDPSRDGSVHVNPLADRLIATWNGVTEFDRLNDSTFQAVLFDTGVIEFHYVRIGAIGGKTGLSPGSREPAPVNFAAIGAPSTIAGTIFERFNGNFDLSGRRVTLTPSGPDAYTVAVGAPGSAALGTPLGGDFNLFDDDSRAISFTGGFSFPFYGRQVKQLYVNSNGSLTVDLPDFTFPLAPGDADDIFFSGLLRIAPMIEDWDPEAAGASVRVNQLSDRLLVTWSAVPRFGFTESNTFQVRILNTGVIEFDFIQVVPAVAGVTGIVKPTELVHVDLDATAPFAFSDAACEFFGSKGFDLSGSRLLFTPSGASYGVTVGPVQFDANLGVNLGIPIGGSRQRTFTSPFTFPYYGAVQTGVFVNANGSLSFGQGDGDPFASLGSLFTALPRIAAVMGAISPVDFDPTDAVPIGVFYRQDVDRAVITWLNVEQIFLLDANTFQVTLFSDGRIAIDYLAVSEATAIAGLGPGVAGGGGALFDFSAEAPLPPAPGVIAEWFATLPQIDIFRTGQVFYETRPDDFDFLVLFANFAFDLGGGFAFEYPVQNSITGIGLSGVNTVADNTAMFGSAGRLTSFLNMNELNAYPDDLTQVILGLGDNSALSVFGQEAGHRWLAFPRVTGVPGVGSFDLLGRDGSHWNFYMDSGASVMEGNDWVESAPGIFDSVDTVSRYSLLDRYMMGLVPASAVPPFFVILNPSPNAGAGFPPTRGARVSGQRVNITVQNIIAVEGPRIPAFPNTPREFNMALVLVTREGRPATQADLDKINDFRLSFSRFFHNATGRRGSLNVILDRSSAVPGDAWMRYRHGPPIPPARR